MSTIPLRARDQAAPEGTQHYHSAVPPEDRPGSIDEAKMDSVVSDAMKNFPDPDAEPAPKSERKSMDALISEGLDKHEAAIEDKEAFDKSKDARTELDHRYKGFGGDTSKTLDLFLHMADELKANPRGAAQTIAEAYLKSSRYALDSTPAAKTKPEAIEIGGKRYSGNVLDHIIEDAINSAGAERETFEATAVQRQRLKGLWPDLSFDQAMNRIRQVDRRLHEEPLLAAAELGAAFGMPVTPRQEQVEAEKQQADTLVTEASKVLPGMNDPSIRQRMAQLIQSNPAYQGVDEVTVLNHAYQIAAQEYNQDMSRHEMVRDKLNQIAQANSVLAAEIVTTLVDNKDFAKLAVHIPDPVAKLQAAVGYILAQEKSNNQAAVEKAKRAAPVKSSSGALGPSGGKSGMDSAIANAMKDFS